MAKVNKSKVRNINTARRIEDVATRYCQGTPVTQLAMEHGVTRQQIYYDLKVVRTEWLERVILDYDQKRADELAKIDKMELEANLAWETSKNTDPPGDPRFLAMIDKAIGRRIAMFQLDDPEKYRRSMAVADETAEDNVRPPILTVVVNTREEVVSFNEFMESVQNGE